MLALAIYALLGYRLSPQHFLLADDGIVWLRTKTTLKIIAPPRTVSPTLAFATLYISVPPCKDAYQGVAVLREAHIHIVP